MCSDLKTQRLVEDVERIHALAHKIVGTLGEAYEGMRAAPKGGWSQIAAPLAWAELIEKDAALVLEEMKEGGSHV